MKSRLGSLALLPCALLGAAVLVVPAAPAMAALPPVSGEITLVGHHLEGATGAKELVIDFHDATPSVTAGDVATYTLALVDEETPDALAEDFTVTMDAAGDGQLRVGDLFDGDVEIREFADAAQGSVADRSASFVVDYLFAQPDYVEANMETIDGVDSFIAGRPLAFTNGPGAWAAGVTFQYEIYRLDSDPNADPTLLEQGDGWPTYAPPAELVGKDLAVVVLATLDADHYDLPLVWVGPVAPAPVPDTIPPATVQSVMIERSSITTDSMRVGWGAVTDNVRVAGYKIYLNGVEARSVDATVAPPNMESVELTDLESSTTYLVTVRAFDAAGNLGAPSAYADDRTKDLPDDIAPSAVPNFTLRSVSRSTLEVAWGAATDNVRVAGYSLSLNGGPEVATGDSVTDFTFRNISPDTDYSISIRAKDLVGNVGPAQTIMATTPPIDPACARNTADVWRARGWRVIVGTPGNDVLQGTAAREVFIGGSGDDVIYARGGDDLICAGTGADVVRAGPGADQIHTADRDRDQIYGGLGRDRAWIDGGGEGVIRSVRLLNAL